MAYDEGLAARVRDSLGRLVGEAREIRMFGGLCWTVNTHMTVGVFADDLMISVGSDGVDEAIAAGARQSMMGERTMTGIVNVAAADLPTAEALDAWVGPAVARAQAKPPKPPKPPKKSK